MFSSGNRSKENNQNYPTQWALNPSAYQNVSNEHVDWAALAQQWIMMKESVPPELPANRKEVLNEGGEAPMDVEKEDVEDQWQNNDAPNPNTNSSVHESWNWQQWGSWPGNWNGPSSTNVIPPSTTASSINKTALLPTPYTHFTPNANDSNSAHSTDYQSYDGSSSNPGNDFGGSSSGYWTNSGNAGRGKHPMKPNRGHRKGFTPEVRPEPAPEPVTLDAAKRRQLPAWIREGLEKMEREKQKQLNKERERMEREELINRKKEEKEEALELLRAADGSILPPKSKFDSDSGDSGDEIRNGKSGRAVPSKSRRTASSTATSRSISPQLALLTEEERMGMVRRAMTEVLLQVTSSEIESICQEEVSRWRLRTTTAKKGGRSAPAAPSSAGPSAAGTLGLGIYGGGSDSESEDGSGGLPAPPEDQNERRNSSSHNNLHEDGLNTENNRRRQSTSSSSKRPTEPQAGSSDSVDDTKESSEQVDTTRSHGSSSRSRRRRSTSNSSNSSSSSSRSRSSSSSSRKRKKKKASPKKKSRRRHSSSSQSDSSSGSNHRRRRSRSADSDRRRSKRRRTRSTSSERNHSRYRNRRRRTRTRSRSRSRSRSRRDSYRSRRRSRSRTRSRSSGGKRTRGH